MNEILFRGQQKSDKEWTYGYLYSDGNKSYIAYEGKQDCIIHEVMPETVGRYIGGLDKNKKMIFEGDVCRFTDFGKSLPPTYIGVIKYYKNIKAYFVSGNYCTDLSKWKSEDFEVIGNIHDNPELIGDDEK